MSSGSYFTIYRKYSKIKASQDALDALKNEYFLANKNELFGGNRDEEALKNDMPLLMHDGYRHDNMGSSEDNKSNIYYSSEDGTKHDMLLEFHFCSSFTCLKEKFNLNAYSFSRSSIFISRSEAQKMLQAIDYVLSEDYNKKFESILGNEYVELFGEGYSPFDSRFKKHRDPMYIDRDGRNYAISFGDTTIAAETAESDADVQFNLNRIRACLLAYLNAEEDTWDDEELVLEYSAY